MVQVFIVARFLSPSQFGLLAIALLVLLVVETFTASGFAQALIQRKGDITPYLSSVLIANIVRGCALAVLIVLVAPLAAHFFHVPASVDVIRGSAAIVLIRSLGNPALAMVHREFRFHTIALLEICSAAVAFGVSVGLAVELRTVWALILGLVTREAVLTIGSWIVQRWRPTAAYSATRLRELHSFGRWVFLGNILSFLSLQSDTMVVGRMLGAGALGLYEMAFRTSQVPATLISQTASTTAFPALSSVADDRARFRYVYLRMVSSLVLVNLVVTAFLVGAGPWLVELILGERWLSMVPTMRILAIAGFLRSIVTVAGRVFGAAGHPNYDAVINTARLAALAIALYPCVNAWGIEGAAVAVVVSMLVLVPMYFVMLRRATGITIVDHLTFPREWQTSRLAAHPAPEEP